MSSHLHAQTLCTLWIWGSTDPRAGLWKKEKSIIIAPINPDSSGVNPVDRRYITTFFIMTTVKTSKAGHSGCAVKGMNCLRPLEHWDCGSNPTRCMNVCVCLFWVCVLLCVSSGLATDWSPIQGVLPTAYRLRNWKRGQGPQRLYSYR
jgi:hypothetical protein